MTSAPRSSALKIRPILAWILIQLVGLALGASGIPIWTHHPAPRESLAAAELIAVQIIATAMLFPILLPNFSTALVIAFLAMAFLHMAGILSLTPETNLLFASLYVSLCIVGLWLCAGSLESSTKMLLGVCVAELFTLGTVILWYLRLESTTAYTPSESFGPLLGALGQINGSKQSWLAWAQAVLPLIVGWVLKLLGKYH